MKPLPYSLNWAASAQAKHSGATGVPGGTARIVSRVLLGGGALKLANGDLFDTRDDPAEIPADDSGKPHGIFAVAFNPKGRFIALYKFEVRT